jgi:hypothetical protein
MEQPALFGTLKITTVVTLPTQSGHPHRGRRVTLASLPMYQDAAEAAAIAFVEANADTINKRRIEAEFIPQPQQIYIQ